MKSSKLKNEIQSDLDIHNIEIDYNTYFFKFSPDLICLVNIEGYFSRLNQAWEKLGWTLEDLNKESIYFMIHPEDHEKTKAQFAKLANQVDPVKFENRCANKSGDYRWYSWSCSLDKRSNVVVCAGRDMTDVKTMQRNLEEAQKIAQIGSWEWDVKTNLITWSKQQYQIYGHDSSLPITFEIYLGYLCPKEQTRTIEVLDKTLKGEGDYGIEHEITRGDGETRLILEQGSVEFDLNRKPIRMYGASRDITEIKRTENQLVENERLLSTILDNMPIAIFGKNIKKNFQWNLWNKRAEALFGLAAKECMGKSDHDYFPKEQADFFRAKDIEACQVQGIIDIPEETAQTANGTALLRTKKIVIKDANGEPSMLLGMTENVTEERNLVRQLNETKERLSIAISAVKLGVWDWNLKTQVLVWDDLMYDIFDIKKNDFNGAYDAFEKTLLPADAVRVNQELQSAHSYQRINFESQFRVQTNSNSIKYIKCSAKCFYDQAGKIERMVGVNWDETEHKLAEANLMNTDKMASLGEMAGGIAHEINNPLAIIHGSASMICREISNQKFDVDKTKQGLKKIVETTERIAKIIKGLRSFSRKSDSDPMQCIRISQVIEDTVELCKERFKNHSIDLSINCNTDSIIECRQSQIAQVMMNLLGNAIDAVEALPEKWVRIDTFTTGDELILHFTDSGGGLPQAIAKKIMNPFFTTKEVGKGTGLGLSISKGIMESHNGSLTYDPTSKNTRFIVQLPLKQAS